MMRAQGRLTSESFTQNVNFRLMRSEKKVKKRKAKSNALMPRWDFISSVSTNCLSMPRVAFELLPKKKYLRIENFSELPEKRPCA
jgi:hypothetical protein